MLVSAVLGLQVAQSATLFCRCVMCHEAWDGIFGAYGLVWMNTLCIAWRHGLYFGAMSCLEVEYDICTVSGRFFVASLIVYLSFPIGMQKAQASLDLLLTTTTPCALLHRSSPGFTALTTTYS